MDFLAIFEENFGVGLNSEEWQVFLLCFMCSIGAQLHFWQTQLLMI